MAKSNSTVMFMVTYIMKAPDGEMLIACDKLFYTHHAAHSYLFEKIYKNKDQVWKLNTDAIGDVWDYVCEAYDFTDDRGYKYECMLKGIPMIEYEKN